MISGFLSISTSKCSFREVAMRKFKSLYYPYILFYIVSFFLTVLFLRPTLDQTFLWNALKGLLLSHAFSNVNNFALWYLPIAFVTSLVFYGIKKFPVKLYWGIIIFTFFASLSYQALFAGLKNHIPLSVHVLAPDIFCMGLGDFYRHYGHDAIFSNKWGYVFCPIVMLAGAILPFIQVQQIPYINSISYLIAAVLNVSVLLLLLPNPGKIIGYIGRHSLIILGLHRIGIEILKKYGFDGILKAVHLSGLSAAIVTSLFIIVSCLLVSELYSRLHSTRKEIT